jgi:molecular chaperone HscA
MMCLDFGTARSKAMAMRGRGGPVFLKIGKAAKARYENSIASSVWIDPKNRVVLFGDKAIEASLVQGDRQQERIDSLKDFLSSPIGDQLPDPRGRLLPEGMDIQRSGFTVGAILVLYLGYLSWAAEASAQEAGLAGEVSRRFTIPSWPTSHRAAGIGLLREYLARATLAGRFVGSRFLDGLPVEEAKALASAAFEVPTDALPSDLFKEGITEPLAAIGTRTEELTRRNGLVMIVDIGAGTTDFGLFLVSSPKSEPRFIEVASHSINCAGNHLDTHLHEYIFGRMGIGGMAAAAAKLELLLRQREIKEELFGQGRASVSLPAGYSVQLRCNEFLSQDVVRQFQHQLEQALQYTLQQVEDNATRKSVSIDWDRYSQVRVVRTGGGADLPMVKALAPGTWRPRRNPAVSLGDASVQLQSSPLLPDSVQRTGLDAAAYLPLAVAWGGAMPELPTQGKPVELATLSQYDPRKVADAVAVNSEHWSEKKS